MIVTIHQPNFVPWYPFFQKMESADVFVILKHCQFEKNNYQNRFSLNEKWYTMSVNKGMEPICDKRYVNPQKDWDGIKNKLKQYNEILLELDGCISENLAETNSAIIQKIAEMLGIKTRIEFDYPTDLKGTSRLVDICSKYGADTYLSGSSGGNYMDLSEFKKEGIKVVFQDNLIKKHTLEVLHEASIR